MLIEQLANGLKGWNNATRPSSEGNINGNKVFSFPVETFPRKTFPRRSSLDFKGSVAFVFHGKRSTRTPARNNIADAIRSLVYFCREIFTENSMLGVLFIVILERISISHLCHGSNHKTSQHILDINDLAAYFPDCRRPIVQFYQPCHVHMHVRLYFFNKNPSNVTQYLVVDHPAGTSTRSNAYKHCALDNLPLRSLKK